MNGRTTMLASAAALAVTLPLTACSNTAAGGGDGKTLTIAATTTSKPAVVEAIAAFEKANPGVTVKATYADTDALLTTLRTQLASGTAPDVFTVWPGWGNAVSMNTLQDKGYLADLSGHSFTSRIPAELKRVTQVDGKTYVVPLATVGIGAIYNVQAVKAADAALPTTYNEVLAFCDKAKAAGKVAFALGNQTPWVTQLVNLALVPTTVYQKDPRFDDEMAAGKKKFVGSGWVTAFDKYLEMNERGCFTHDSLGTSFESTVPAVAKGEALAVVQVNSTLAGIRAQAPTGTTFGMFALPADDNPEHTQVAAGLGDSYGVNAKAKHPELAGKFIDFLATPEAGAAYATTAGALPALPTDAYRADPAMQLLIDFQKAGRIYPFMDQSWPNAKVQQMHLEGVQKVFAGRAKVNDVLKDMDAAYAEGHK